jgi:hypothetical protein
MHNSMASRHGIQTGMIIKAWHPGMHGIQAWHPGMIITNIKAWHPGMSFSV